MNARITWEASDSVKECSDAQVHAYGDLKWLLVGAEYRSDDYNTLRLKLASTIASCLSHLLPRQIALADGASCAGQSIINSYGDIKACLSLGEDMMLILSMIDLRILYISYI